MLDTFIICLKALKNYTGLKLLFGLTLIAWIYLLVCEKRKSVRTMFVLLPLIIGILFVCPFSYMIFSSVGLDKDIYYRLLWILPLGMLTVYAIVKMFKKNWKTRLLGTLIAVALIAVTGRCIYTCEILFKSENIYGIPQQTINVVDFLRNIDQHERITVLPSADLITTIRQYDSTVCMPYGRDIYNASLEYTHPIYELYERPERLNFENLLTLSRDFEIEYIIVYAARLLEDDPEAAGLEYLGCVDDHLIYRDPVMAERIALLDTYYPD